MISAIESQSGGSGANLVQQVEEMFSPRGYFPNRATSSIGRSTGDGRGGGARAEGQEHLLVEAGTGVGKSFAYLVPAILFAVARKKKAGYLPPHHQPAGAAHRKDLPVLKTVLPVEFSHAMLKGRQNYLLHPPPAQGHGAANELVHVARAKRAGAHLRMVEENEDGSSPTSRRSRMRRSGRTSARSAGCARRRFAGINRTLRRATAFVFPAGAGRIMSADVWC